MEVNTFDKLVELLSPYDAGDLLAAIGGLQLMPENANQALRLEALAHAAASIVDTTPKPSIGCHKLKVIGDSKLPEGVYQAEDPCETPFTEAFTFIGGSYVVFPGGFEESTFVVRHLASALFLHSEPIPDLPFIRYAREVLGGSLALSDELARRAGLKRHLPPGEERGRLVVPNSEKLSTLKRSVTFSLDEMNALLEKYGLPSSCLDRLIIDAGDAALGPYEIGESTLLIRPLVRVGNKILATIPTALLSAAKHEILRSANEHGVLGDVADRYSDAVWNTVLDSLDYLRIPPFGTPSSGNSIAGAKEALFRLDADKIIYAMLLTDPLENYESDSFYGGDWKPADLAQKIEARIDEVAYEVLRQASGLNAILSLVVIQGVGRFHIFGFRKKCDATCFPMLCLTAADLQTLSFLEAGDPLFLWKYSCAATTIREKAMIHAFGELDEVHLYRKWGYSYYGSDEERPGAFFIAPGTGTAELRQEVLRQRDWHGVNSYRAGLLVEVSSLHDTASIPLYAPIHSLGQRVELFVEALSIPVWIVGPEYRGDGEKAYHGLYAEIAGGIGYWLWQLSPSLNPVLRTRLTGMKSIVIWLEIIPDDAWFAAIPPAGSFSQPIGWALDRANSSITVTLGSEMGRRFEGPDNTGDRELMTGVLKALSDGDVPTIVHLGHDFESKERIQK